DDDGCVTLSYRYTSHSAYSDTLDDFLRAVLRWLFTIRLLRNGRRGFFQVSTMKSHRIADPQHRINKTSIRWTDFHIEAFKNGFDEHIAYHRPIFLLNDHGRKQFDIVYRWGFLSGNQTRMEENISNASDEKLIIPLAFAMVHSSVSFRYLRSVAQG